jgi:hypothetical protein
MPLTMSSDATEIALGRIERALARIEAAAARPTANPFDNQAFAALSKRHEALLGETRAALAEVESLIQTAGSAA